MRVTKTFSITAKRNTSLLLDWKHILNTGMQKDLKQNKTKIETIKRRNVNHMNAIELGVWKNTLSVSNIILNTVNNYKYRQKRQITNFRWTKYEQMIKLLMYKYNWYKVNSTKRIQQCLPTANLHNTKSGHD